LPPGAKVKIVGRSVGSELYVAACCDTTVSSSVQMIQPPAPPVGDQRTLVMIADLLDASVSCSTDNVRETLFAPPTNVFDDNGNGLSVNGEYLASSYGKVSWSGQVRRSTLNIQSTDACDLDLYSRTLDAAAAAAGIDLASYPRKLYVFPPMSQCAFIGASTTGATSSSFSFSCSTRGNYSHELGHGLGMSHAAAYYDAYTAGHGSYDNRLNQYGDYSDSMASSGWQLRGFNAPHREQMGWLPWTAEQIVNQSGQYNLAPLSMDPSTVSAPQAIKIPKADGGFYYLSYRGGQLFDRYSAWYVTRVSVHRYGAPSDAASGFTFLYAALANGLPGEDTFTDPVNGITVRMLSGFGAAPGSGAVVDISITAPVTLPAAPGGLGIAR
jgi:Gametolysin peptidase M11